MSKIDFIKLKEDRLEQIKIDMKRAYFTKNKVKYNELKAEKEVLEQNLREIKPKN